MKPGETGIPPGVLVPEPELEIEKEADKSGKTYELGDLITYTIDVTQRIQDAVAKNVVITDTILTEGVKLQKTSWCCWMRKTRWSRSEDHCPGQFLYHRGRGIPPGARRAGRGIGWSTRWPSPTLQ